MQNIHLCKLLKLLLMLLYFKSPNWNLPFELMSDSSSFVLGSVLGQKINKKPVVKYFVSKTLFVDQVNYCMIENEFLPTILALKIFCLYLLGCKVIIFISHVA